MTFFNYTPFSFLFMLVYLCLFVLLFIVSSFYAFWLIMELLILALIGVSYSILVSCYSSLIYYFLIQTYASFRIFCFFILNSEIWFFLIVLNKLRLFPFHFWFPSVCYRFPNLLLLTVSTVHKFPIYLALYRCSLSVSTKLLMLRVILTMLVLGAGMWFLNEFRMFLVFSTRFNGAWLMLAYAVSFNLFSLYLSVYALFLGAIFFVLGLKSRISIFKIVVSYRNIVYLFCLMLLLSGLPPSPLFFIKCIVIWAALRSGIPVWFLTCSLISTVFVVVSYFVFVFSHAVYKYTCSI